MPSQQTEHSKLFRIVVNVLRVVTCDLEVLVTNKVEVIVQLQIEECFIL